MNAMLLYPALIDGDEGAYGVVFPDIPGVGAMGYTVKDALVNAEDALREYAIEMEKDGVELATPSPIQSIPIPEGNQLVSVSLRTARITLPKGSPCWNRIDPPTPVENSIPCLPASRCPCRSFLRRRQHPHAHANSNRNAHG